MLEWDFSGGNSIHSSSYSVHATSSLFIRKLVSWPPSPFRPPSVSCLSTRRISWSVQCSKFISGATISNFFRSILHFVGWWIFLSCSVSELSFDSETFSCSHLRSLPGDSADAVALVEQRLVGRREQRVFKQMSILLTLSPQSRERLTLVRNRHHPAHTNTDRCGYGGKSLNYPQCVFCIYKNI